MPLGNTSDLVAVHWVDLILGSGLVMAVLVGLARGLVREAVSFLTTVVTLLIAGVFYKPVADLISVYVPDRELAMLAAFGAAAGMTGIVLNTLREVALRSRLPRSRGILEVVLGGALGLASGYVTLTIFTALLLAYPIRGVDQAILDSPLATTMLERGEVVYRLLPADLRPKGSPALPPGRLSRLEARLGEERSW